MPGDALPIRPALAAIAGGWLALWGTLGLAQEPLSAIDWLSRTAAELLIGLPMEPPVADGVVTPTVAVTPLDMPAARDAVGLLPGAVTGLPATLWSASRADRLAHLIERQDPVAWPAMQGLLYTLLLAEADPPADGAPDTLLLARLDKLIWLGALEPAAALMERAGADTRPLFSRAFDAHLLLGTEDELCTRLTETPHLAPDYRARVFCWARAGDWTHAATTLGSARALGLLSDAQDALLARFLDPDMFDGEAPPAAPAEPDALSFRLFEAIGEPIQSAGLARRFAMADLRDTVGWKAELESAERLAASGALAETRLLALYTARDPAASGMVWDRVAAVQRLDRALASQAPDRLEEIAAALPAAWRAFSEAHVEVPMARLFGPRLIGLKLKGEAAGLAARLALLSPEYERAANTDAAAIPESLAEIARGQPPSAPRTNMERAIAAAFSGALPPAELAALQSQGRLGEMLLSSMILFMSGAAGDMPALTGALSALRSVGLEDIARRAALQLLILERRV